MMAAAAAARGRCCSPAVAALRTSLAPTPATAACAPASARQLLPAAPRRFAGHSKWAKIARSKGAADQARGALFSKHAAAIKAAALSGDALRLQTAVDKAKRDNTPAHVIDKARDVSARGEEMEQIVYEGIGPASTAVLVECLTPSRNRAAKTVRAAFNKFGGELQSSGSVSWQFTSRGRFTLALAGGGGAVEQPQSQPQSQQQQEEALLEAVMGVDGVEDVEFPGDDVEEADDDNEEGGAAAPVGGGASGGGAAAAAALPPPAAAARVAYLYCDVARLGSVRNGLITAGHTPLVSEVTRTPQALVEVPPGDAADAFAAFLERLDELEDVQAVHHNASG